MRERSTASIFTPTTGRLVRTILVLPLIAAALLARPRLPVRAQTPEDQPRCFADEAPAITACISGRFRTFWEANGGLQVFGYPLTEAAPQTTADGAFTTQYFERARFELHPENQPPYDVLLGRLGAERLSATGGNRQDQPADTAADGCQFWAETQRNVCEPFLTAWRAGGLQNDSDPALNDAERLALWGLPLTKAEPITTANGVALVQWFERARFEQQVDGSVTFGLLGKETLQGSNSDVPAPDQSPAPPPTAPAMPATPNVVPPSVPCNVNVPTPAEGLQVWMVDPQPSRDEDAVACVRLIVNGEAVNGANAMTYRYIGNERRPSIPQSTGQDGVASFIFYIKEESPSARIPVEADVTFRGTTYVAYTEFTPR